MTLPRALPHFVLVLVLATPALALEIGDAASLPWEGDSEFGLRLDYQVERLPADTVALLGTDVPLLVRYETLRRATSYLSVRGSPPSLAAPVRARLQRALDERAAAENAPATARFDADCFRLLQGDGVDKGRVAALPLPKPELSYVLHRETSSDDHLTAAVDGAREGSLLALNLLRDFNHEYGSLAELREGLEGTDDPFDGPMFPQPPPLAEADPTTRHGVTLLAPWRLVVRKTDEGTAVTWAKETPWRIRLRLGHHMVIGTRIVYEVHVKGERQARYDSEEELGGEPIHAAHSTSFLQDVPAGAVVKAHAQVFETDIPPQHMWGPTAGRYRVLWEHRYEATVP